MSLKPKKQVILLEPTTRNVDLILGDDQEEQWIELKSYEGKSKKDAHLMAYLKNKKKVQKRVHHALGT